MAVISLVDFSSGMVTAVGGAGVPKGSMLELVNADVWSKHGTIRPHSDFSLVHSFPSGKTYDHHILFPVHGDKDYILVMMTDGAIYTYHPSTGFSANPLNPNVSDQQPGARMVYAGDFAYVFYRDLDAPSLSNTFRKVIRYDYDNSLFLFEDILISNNSLDIADVTEISWGLVNSHYDWRAVFTQVYPDGSESFGVVLSGSRTDGGPNYIKVRWNTSNAPYRIRYYFSKKGKTDSVFVTPGFISEFYYENLSVESVFFPTGSGMVSRSNVDPKSIIITYSDSGTDVRGFFSEAISQGYFISGNKVRVFGVEATVTNISDSGIAYILTLDKDVPYFSYSDKNEAGGAYIEIELKWKPDGFGAVSMIVPVETRLYEMVGVPIDLNRPESKYTSGTGNLVAVASGRLFTANPYFPDVYGTGEDNDKRGFLAWSWITGEGKYAMGLVPDTQLYSPVQSGESITGLINIGDTLIVFQPSGITRLKFEDNVLLPVETRMHGIENIKDVYVSVDRFFIVSNKRIFMGRIDTTRHAVGYVDLIEVSRPIYDKIAQMNNIRLVYDHNNEMLHVTDSVTGDSYFCSMRDGNIVWSKGDYSGSSYSPIDGFMIDGEFYYIAQAPGPSNAVVLLNSVPDVVSGKTYDIPLPMANYFVRDVEVYYILPSGSCSVMIYLDGVLVKSHNLPIRSVYGFEKIKFDRGVKTRADTIRLDFELSSVDPGFEIGGIFVNRGDYGFEPARGY